ncbi:MAG: hypothetical protein ACI39E_01015, partial [Acutalibacteraceae bacterium]
RWYATKSFYSAFFDKLKRRCRSDRRFFLIVHRFSPDLQAGANIRHTVPAFHIGCPFFGIVDSTA